MIYNSLRFKLYADTCPMFENFLCRISCLFSVIRLLVFAQRAENINKYSINTAICSVLYVNDANIFSA